MESGSIWRDSKNYTELETVTVTCSLWVFMPIEKQAKKNRIPELVRVIQLAHHEEPELLPHNEGESERSRENMLGNQGFCWEISSTSATRNNRKWAVVAISAPKSSDFLWEHSMSLFVVNSISLSGKQSRPPEVLVACERNLDSTDEGGGGSSVSIMV